MKKNDKFIALDKKYIWHPFTQMAEWVQNDPAAPLVIDRGQGSYLIDNNGKKYIDGVSSLWVNVHGHRKNALDKALIAQLRKIAHTTFLGLTHKPAVELAQKLVKLAGRGLSKVFYSDNGSTSVEVALKMAYQYAQLQGKKGKYFFLSLENAYHGDTIGSVSVGGMSLFHKRFRKLLFKTFYAPSPYCLRCKHRKGDILKFDDAKNFAAHKKFMGCNGECVLKLKEILNKNKNRLAGAIIEPMMQGAAGMIKFPKGYTLEFSKLVKSCGLPLICDEVATGFGRTGKMFAVEHENIKPDILCLSKGITGGYLPLAVTLVTNEIYNSFLGKYEEFKTFFHGHSYTANPLACAVANENLNLFNKERIVERLAGKIKYLGSCLKEFETHKNVAQVRQLGMMAGIELVKSRNPPADFAVTDKVAIKICAAARNYGLIIRPLGNVLVLMPPLSISNSEINAMMTAIRKSMKESLN